MGERPKSVANGRLVNQGESCGREEMAAG